MQRKTLNLSKEVVQVVRTHDARLLHRDGVAQFFQMGMPDCAIALFQCVPSWHDKRVLALVCNRKELIKKLRQQWRSVADWAYRNGLEKVLLGAEGQDPYPIPATSLGDSQGQDGQSPIAGGTEIEAMRIAERMSRSEKPMGMVDLETDIQVWSNDALLLLTGDTQDVSRSRNIRALWQQQGDQAVLDYIKQTLRQQGQLLSHPYTTQLTESHRCHFVSNFEVVLDNRYRLTTLLEVTPAEARV